MNDFPDATRQILASPDTGQPAILKPRGTSRRLGNSVAEAASGIGSKNRRTKTMRNLMDTPRIAAGPVWIPRVAGATLLLLMTGAADSSAQSILAGNFLPNPAWY